MLALAESLLLCQAKLGNCEEVSCPSFGAPAVSAAPFSDRSCLGDFCMVARKSMWMVVRMGCAVLKGDASAVCGRDEYVAVGDSL